MKTPIAAKYLFGAHQFLWKQRWTDEDLGIFDRVSDLGLTVFEVSIGDDVFFDHRRFRWHAEAAGIELSFGPGNLWPMDCDISHDDPENRVSTPST